MGSLKFLKYCILGFFISFVDSRNRVIYRFGEGTGLAGKVLLLKWNKFLFFRWGFDVILVLDQPKHFNCKCHWWNR
jgi:hypothetical protein